MYISPQVIMQFITRKPFGIHSPFVYDFAQNCILNSGNIDETLQIEQARKNLLGDFTQLMVTDFGRGRKFGKKKMADEPLKYNRSVASIAKNSLQSPSMCRFLFRTTRFMSPETILELGTSLGVTTACLAKAAPQAKIISLEGCPQTAARAANFFRDCGVNNIDLRVGPFSQLLSKSLNDLARIDMVYIDGDHTYQGVLNNFITIEKHIHTNSVLILDDIRWSKGMRKAWLEITGSPMATLAIDMYRLGLVFFNPGFSKQIVPVAF